MAALFCYRLSDDGTIWITIDDNEVHYLKVLCDEIFGRACGVANVVWRSSDAANTRTSSRHVFTRAVITFPISNSCLPLNSWLMATLARAAHSSRLSDGDATNATVHSSQQTFCNG
jgi:hypothetical protein